MPSPSTATPFIVTITKHLPLVEKVLLGALAIGIILIVMQIDFRLAKISLMGLGVTFFLQAYRPSEIVTQDGDQPGFKQLFGLMIAPKVLWISSAISAVGIGLYLSDNGNDGYRQMLLIGGLSITSATLILLAFLVSGMKQIQTVIPILLRALPLGLADFYLLLR